MTIKRLVAPVLMMFFAVCIHSQAWALATSEADYNIDFRFNNPGARASAMGGAFIGMADDATAAYTNPAGLTILTQPEASFEFKLSENETDVYLYDGTGNKETIEETVSGVSFLSYVKPLDKITFCLYRHELLNLEFDSIDGPYQIALVNYDLLSDINLNTVTYGAGIGLKIIDSMSIGFSFGFAQTDYHYTVYTRSDDGRISPYSYVNDDTTATQYNLSFLYNPFGELNIGMVYRYGPEFETIYFSVDDGTSIKNTLDVPDVYGVGISYRFFNCLTIALDVNRIEYSDLTKNYYYYDSNEVFGLRWKKNINEFDIDDTTEVHVGLEYVFSLNNTPLAVRCGYQNRPEHNIRYIDDEIDVYKETRKEGEDEDIYSIGFGSVISNNIQMDISASIGDFVKEYIVSCVYRFE